MANNKLVFTFNRDFTLGDQTKLVLTISSAPIIYNFVWVNTSPVGFEVEVATPTGTTGEATAINFATAWGNSVTGYTVTRALNVVTIVGSDDVEFLSLTCLDSGNNSYLIPTDYDVSISTQTSGNKITYTDKVGNTISGDAFRQWRDVDANEVKTKFNLNDDRIGVNETNIAANTSSISGKANLSGGNSFSGDQAVTGDVTIFSDNGIEDNEGQLTVGKSSTGRVAIGTSNDKPAIQGFGTGTSFDLLLNPSAGRVGVGYDGTSALNTSYLFQVNGDILANNIDSNWNGNSVDDILDRFLGIENTNIDTTTLDENWGAAINTSTSLGDVPNTFVHIANLAGDGAKGTQIASRYTADPANEFYMRAATLIPSQQWKPWKRLLHESNYTDFTDYSGETLISESITVGTSGQSNTITLLGDTGEELTITKFLAGQVRFSNTNSDAFTFDGSVETTGTLRAENYTVSTLPSGSDGEITFVTDATATTFYSIVAGGGSNFVPVFYDGTDWRIG